MATEFDNIVIPIKMGWDHPPDIYTDHDDHSHVLRAVENPLLLDFLLRRKEGALLLSGKRGVGKSSAIVAALKIVMHTDRSYFKSDPNSPHPYSAALERNVLERNEEVLIPVPGPFGRKSFRRSHDLVYVPVFINAPSFNIYKKETKAGDPQDFDAFAFKRVLLQTLVRRLFESARRTGVAEDPSDQRNKTRFPYDPYYHKPSRYNPQISKKLAILYRKAVATEFRQEDKTEELRKEKENIEKSRTVTTEITAKLAVTSIASFFIALLVGLYPPLNTFIFNSDILTYVSNAFHLNPQVLKGIIPLLIAAVPPIALSVKWEMTKVSSLLSEEENSATVYYRYDYDVSTLESELEELLDLFQLYNYKVIFIIDELDKLDKNIVLKVIESLKALFNQSSSLFILITDQDYFDTFIEDDSTKNAKNSSRGIWYTLFSQKIFLQRPQFEEIKMFLNNIVDKERLDNKSREGIEYPLRVFTNYACYFAKSDYFDLYNALRDHMSYNEGGPILNLKLEKEQITLANLQETIEVIYKRKKYKSPSDWYKNDNLLDRIYEFMDRLNKQQVNALVTREKAPRFKVDFHDSNSPRVRKKDSLVILNEVEASTISELMDYLSQEDLKYLVPTDKPGQFSLRGVLEKIPKVTQILTKEERSFISEYESFRSIVISYSNAYIRYGKKVTYEYTIDSFENHLFLIFYKIINQITEIPIKQNYLDRILDIFYGLTLEKPESFPREDLEALTDLLRLGKEKLLNGLINSVKMILESRNQRIETFLISNYEVEETLGLYHTGSQDKVPSSLLIESDPKGRKLLVLQNPTDQMIRRINKRIREKKAEWHLYFVTKYLCFLNRFVSQ